MDVRISDLSLSYGDFQAVKNLSLDIGEGESLVLLGQSGCGKTSTMRCIAGLEEPSTGSISIGGSPVFDSLAGTNVPPNKRNVGMVFQSYAIWPHMTVLENVSFPLQMKRMNKTAIRRKALETLELVGLDHLAEKGASLLSGGQMQRVALARSLAMGPSVMLLDEPLSNLDARLREDLRAELRRIQLELGLTSVYVTHDQGEALALADQIAIMQHGRISQLSSPTEIYRSPASASIALFLGMSNVFKLGHSNAGRAELADYAIEVALEQAISSQQHNMSVCIRPEDISISRESSRNVANSWPGTVTVKLFQGSHTRWSIELDGGPTIEVETRTAVSSELHPNDRVFVEVQPSRVLVLPDEVAVPSDAEFVGPGTETEGLDTQSIGALSTKPKRRRIGKREVK
ncbi:ABC transporter ATP-binding protein [Leucobacter celer]|uniref:ABC transporter ATP-binding protein n=1 Tax=Leucobacter celer TaxID=668625 RepID=UPI000949AFEF|nr:ABC transporter ATP-binding protein [Leucobacter celer]